jgi:tRNA (uracil-5-)-methyltransferase TRM9
LHIIDKATMPRASDPTLANVQEACRANGLDASEYEQANVHAVYESIASHFSDTRYKPWPLIPAFLDSLPIGSVGADVGCGNGKYLASYNILAESEEARILTLGVDRSSNLIDIARDNFASSPRSTGSRRRNEVCVGDALCTNYRSGCFDFAISIATIHHMSTFERRSKAVQEMIRLISPVPASEVSTERSEKHSQGPYAALTLGRGRFLIVVWAREQRGQSRRQFENVCEEVKEVEMLSAEQDLLVPWILRKDTDATKAEVFQRFYHVFSEGELESVVEDAAKKFSDLDVKLEMNGWEKGNWYGIWRCVQR